MSRSFEKLHPGEETASEGASNASQVTPAAILNGAYMEILLWDDSQIFPEVFQKIPGNFVTFSVHSQCIEKVTKLPGIY